VRGAFTFVALFAVCISCWPGVARRPVTFLASPRKVTKRRSAPTRYREAPVREGRCSCVHRRRTGRLQLFPKTGLRLTSHSCPGSPVLRTSLRCSTHRAAAQLALASEGSDSARRLLPASLCCSAALKGDQASVDYWDLRNSLWALSARSCTPPQPCRASCRPARRRALRRFWRADARRKSCAACRLRAAIA